VRADLGTDASAYVLRHLLPVLLVQLDTYNKIENLLACYEGALMKFISTELSNGYRQGFVKDLND